MNDLEYLVNGFRQQHTLNENRYKEDEKKQNEEYDELLQSLTILKNDVASKTEVINKNLNILTVNKHSIDKLVNGSEILMGLPIPNKHCREVLNSIHHISSFTNGIQDIPKSLDSKNNIDSTRCIEEVNICTNNVKQEVKKVKNIIDQAKTLYNNVKIIKEYCIYDDEHDSFDRSIIFDV